MNYDQFIKQMSELIGKYVTPEKQQTQQTKPKLNDDPLKVSKTVPGPAPTPKPVSKPAHDTSKYITIQVNGGNPYTATVVYNNAFTNDDDGSKTCPALIHALAVIMNKTMGDEVDHTDDICETMVDSMLRYSLRYLMDALIDGSDF